jgi:CspA family cold shock protein
MADNRMEGTVRWFNRKKGFGFIVGGDGPDVFVHFTSLVNKRVDGLRTGDLVEYALVPGEKGPKASEVVIKQSVRDEEAN